MQTDVDWDAIESPLELARALWTPEGWALAPGRFEALFDRVYGATTDLDCLWQLGGAANDYLRAHPGAIAVSSKLPLTLLRSIDREARVVGLKLLGRCGVPCDQLVEEIIRALAVDDEYERCGGLCELDEILGKLETGKNAITLQSNERLAQALRSLLPHKDPYTRNTAERQLELLRELRQTN